VKLSHHTIGILGILILSACGRGELQQDTDPALGTKIGVQTCTMIAAAGVTVRAAVPAGWDAEALRRELKVQVSDENGPVELQSSSGNPAELVWSGAYEQQGTFNISVTLRSVTSRTYFTVEMGPDGCHVQGAVIDVGFAPPNLILVDTHQMTHQ